MSDTTRVEYLSHEGLKLVADVGGRAGSPAVILLHGGGQTRHSWTGATAMLIAAGYQVINFDARGHGESDWSPSGDYDLSARTRDLMTVVAGNIAPVALVGASMGGMTSFHAVGSGLLPTAKVLIMVDITMRPAPEGVAKIKNFMAGHRNGFATLDEVSDAVSAYNPGRPRPRDPTGLMKNLRLRNDGRLYWHWDPRMLDVSPNPDTPDWTDQLVAVSRDVKIPTLLIRGGQSDIVDDAAVAEMRRLVPQTEVFDVQNAGHMVVGDENDAFNQGLLGFLMRHMPAL